MAMLSGQLPWTKAEDREDDDYLHYRQERYSEDACWSRISVPAMSLLIQMLKFEGKERPKIEWFADEKNGPKWCYLFYFLALEFYFQVDNGTQKRCRVQISTSRARENLQGRKIRGFLRPKIDQVKSILALEFN